jgi:predicted nucleic acid-binding protein
MIAVDACVVISFLAGEAMSEVDAFAALLENDRAALAPSTVAELLSDPKGGARTAMLIDGLKTLQIEEGYWRRAGLLRAAVRRAGRKAALGDALAAQACLDADVPLLTCDADFKAFAEVARLRLAA